MKRGIAKLDLVDRALGIFGGICIWLGIFIAAAVVIKAATVVVGAVLRGVLQ